MRLTQFWSEQVERALDLRVVESRRDDLHHEVWIGSDGEAPTLALMLVDGPTGLYAARTVPAFNRVHEAKEFWLVVWLMCEELRVALHPLDTLSPEDREGLPEALPDAAAE